MDKRDHTEQQDRIFVLHMEVLAGLERVVMDRWDWREAELNGTKQ